MLSFLGHSEEDWSSVGVWSDHASTTLAHLLGLYLANKSPRKNLTISPTATPIFPTISTSLIIDQTAAASKHQKLHVNAPFPIPFETDLFKGHIVFLLRSESADHDPVHHNHVFSGAGNETTQLVIQLQGRFKRRPRGTVYMGLELQGTENVEARLFSNNMTRALSWGLLSIVKKVAPAVHYSYGSQTERPHIVAPIETVADCAIASYPSAVLDDTKPRRGFKINSEDYMPVNSVCESWNTDDLYTFSFSNDHVNFPSWCLVNMPLGPETVSLRRFWGDDNIVRLIAYEAESGKEHNIEEISYMLCAEVKTHV